MASRDEWHLSKASLKATGEIDMDKVAPTPVFRGSGGRLRCSSLIRCRPATQPSGQVYVAQLPLARFRSSRRSASP